MKKVITVGEILVEIMATEVGNGFLEPIPLVGPFPSGAPAIFIDQAAKLGQPCGLIGCVGDDDFGRLNVERLRRDGADVSAIAVDPDRPTGSAFVRYRADGARDFVYNIRHSASGAIALTAASDALIDSADHLHVMGSALSSPAIAAMVRVALGRIRARGGTVSFDPNLRKEILVGARNAGGARGGARADRPLPPERRGTLPRLRRHRPECRRARPARPRHPHGRRQARRRRGHELRRSRDVRRRLPSRSRRSTRPAPATPSAPHTSPSGSATFPRARRSPLPAPQARLRFGRRVRWKGPPPRPSSRPS